MARIKIAYLGGGSTRAAGTMASFLHTGGGLRRLRGRPDRPRRRPARPHPPPGRAHGEGPRARHHHHGDHRPARRPAPTSTPSSRASGPAASRRACQDERIPLSHGVIGQETQGPGGFFMALRSINVLQQVAAELAEVAPRAKVFNYTNPVNIVAQAWTRHSDIPLVSLCEGPIIFPRELARDLGLDDGAGRGPHGRPQPRLLVRTTHTYDGRDFIEVIAERLQGPELPRAGRAPRAAGRHRWAPSRPTTSSTTTSRTRSWRSCGPSPPRAPRTSWSRAPGYWDHYDEQVTRDEPQLDPARSRGGIHELELAIDVMDAVFNGKDEMPPRQRAEPRRRAARPARGPRGRGLRAHDQRLDRRRSPHRRCRATCGA